MGARGTMRRQSVALLQDEPDGLTPAEMQTRHGVGSCPPLHRLASFPRLAMQLVELFAIVC